MTSGTPAGATTTVAQLLSNYPEFPLGYTSGRIQRQRRRAGAELNLGSSYFHSLNVRVQRRLSGGITLIGNYIFSKLMDQTTWLNDTDPRPEKRIGVFDHTHRGVITVTYALPVGKGRRGGNRVALAQPAGGRMAAQCHLYQAERPAFHVDGDQFDHHRRPGVFRRQVEFQPARDQRPGVQHQRLRHAGRQSIRVSHPHLLDDVLQPARRRHQRDQRLDAEEDRLHR